MQCPICQGRGQVECMSPADNMEFYQQTCTECDGTGTVLGKQILSYDIKTNHLFNGRSLRPGWYNTKFNKVFLDKRGISVTLKVENQVIKREQLEANKFYIGSNSIFSRGNKGWGHPTEAEAVEHAQRMLSENKEASEVFIVEIIKVVRRKPIDVDIEEV